MVVFRGPDGFFRSLLGRRYVTQTFAAGEQAAQACENAWLHRMTFRIIMLEGTNRTLVLTVAT